MTRDPKETLRRTIRGRIEALPPAARRHQDEELRRQALLLPELLGARRILAYVPLADEVDLAPLLATLLKRSKELLLPRVQPEDGGLRAHPVTDLEADLQPGALGVREPRAALPAAAPTEIDLILTPGRAFDAQGRRLGRGAGYYDRFLARSPATRVALCYDEQLVDTVPTDRSDEPVDVVLTPSRLFRPGRAAGDGPGGFFR